MKRNLTILFFLVVLILHQDNWNWEKTDLLFGFMPIGLAWHAGISILAALFGVWCCYAIWPSEDEGGEA